MPLEINQISCVPLRFRAVPYRILPASFPNKLKSTLLNSSIFILLFAIPTFSRVLNPIVSWPLQRRLPLSHPQLVPLYSWVANPAECLIMYPTTYIKKLSPTHSRNLPDCLCSIWLPWVIKVYLQTTIFNSLPPSLLPICLQPHINNSSSALSWPPGSQKNAQESLMLLGWFLAWETYWANCDSLHCSMDQKYFLVA